MKIGGKTLFQANTRSTTKACTEIEPNKPAKAKEFLRSKKTRRWTLIAIAVIAVAICGVFIYAECVPYKLVIEGKTVGYAKSEEAAAQAELRVLERYIPEGAKISAFETDDKIRVRKGSKLVLDKSELLTADQLVTKATTMFDDGKLSELNVVISSYAIAVKEYNLPVKYKKDKTMLAGESRTVRKGKKETGKVLTIYTSEGGKVTGKEKTVLKVIKKGTRKIVYKGIIGLPKGKDWKTYTGAPDFENGAALTQLSLNYLGAPYKYGGYSLTHGIDCVQFVRQMYARYGISLPNSNYGLQHSGTGVSLSNARKGDIVCYSGHVGIYIGNGKVVSALRRGVSVTSVNFRSIKTIRRVVR